MAKRSTPTASAASPSWRHPASRVPAPTSGRRPRFHGGANGRQQRYLAAVSQAELAYSEDDARAGARLQPPSASTTQKHGPASKVMSPIKLLALRNAAVTVTFRGPLGTLDDDVTGPTLDAIVEKFERGGGQLTHGWSEDKARGPALAPGLSE